MTFDRTRGLTAPGAQILARLTSRKFALDIALSFLLACGVFALYTQTLVPSVLDGDQGEFQFMPAVLGIPHPSGFPLYILLGHLWSALPIGTLAYRMNLLSAFLGALAVGSLYLALRVQKVLMFAAVGAVVTLALIPQFWEFSTVAAVYRLHDLLIVLLFAFLAQWERTKEWRWLHLAALAFGLDLANHLTIIFLAPATAILLFAVGGRDLFKQPRAILVSVLLLLSPLILYAYFPLRGSQLVTNSYAVPGWNMAMAQGVVSPFYDSSPAGLFQYFVGGTFFKSVTGHWQWKWDSLASDWTAILLETVNWQVLVLALFGVAWLGRLRPKLAIWLLIAAGTFQLLALEYSYEGLASIGQFSSYFREYYLPSFIAVIIFAAWGIDSIIRGVTTLASRIGARPSQLALAASVVVVALFLAVTVTDLASHRSESLTARSAEIQTKWETVKDFPPDQGAALVGHWGDLTPLWYYQYAEGWRNDLVTINPPDEARVDAWMATGKPLYLAGSLLDWSPGIVRKYRLTPWGPLIRVTNKNYAPASPLSQSGNWTFANDQPMLKLTGYQVSRTSLRVGETLQVDAFWQVLNNIKIGDAVVYLSLENTQVTVPAQSNSPVVNWLPGGQLHDGERALAAYDFTVPWGTRPGVYQLALSLYSIGDGASLSASEGEEMATSVTLGEVRVEPALGYPDTVPSDHAAKANFGNRVTLLGWDGELEQLTPGDTPSLQMIWKSGGPQQWDLSAVLSLENATTSRPVGQQALASDYPANQWRAGEIVLAANSFTLPADLADGDYALTLRVRDAATQKPLSLYEGWFPRGDSFILGQVHVVGRQHSFALPVVPRPQVANFEGRIEILGYDIGPTKLPRGDSLHLKLFWRAQGLMAQSYKFFVHIVDGQGHLLAQHDGVPGGNNLPTTGWLPGEVVTDSFDIPLPKDAPTGLYQIQVGFYDAVTGVRLNVLDGNANRLGDYVQLNDQLELADK